MENILIQVLNHPDDFSEKEVHNAAKQAAKLLEHGKFEGETRKLTRNELEQMDGQPVWVQFVDGSNGWWGLVHLEAFCEIWFSGCNHCTITDHPFYNGKAIDVYRTPVICL